MNIIRDVTAIPDDLVRPVATIGNFDGIHLGHRDLLNRVIRLSKEISGTSVVITFEPHPIQVLRPEKAPKRLTSMQEKIDIFQSVGIDAVVCLDFTPEFSKQTADDFIEDVLYKRLGIKVIFVGNNYKFGKDRAGDIELLRKRGEVFNFVVYAVDQIEIDGQRISSSRIREYLSKGEVDKAAILLGRDYCIDGVVAPGHHRGTELGYPTANIYTVDETLPMDGIYAVKVLHGTESLSGACYIGKQPTFAGDKIAVEVHLFDFNSVLYHEHLKV
ncbi:MAG: bifunctional riboflavin kinase/FAD synthetase, partial [Nitrospira sp.]|nr:bifunctional riboflavin kinase/FAD synthetase [Nitrospira sp.]